MKKLIPLILTVLLAFPAAAQQRAVSRAGDAPGKVRRYLESVSAGQTLKGSSLGVLAIKANGDTVVAWNSSQRLIPASNTKLITTGLALLELGPDFRYETRLGYSGRIEDGVLKGDVYIIGGGDPTLGTDDSVAIPLQTLFGRWKKLLTDAGIRRVEGRVVGDGRYFDGPIEKDSWSYQDIGTYYGAGGNGLGFYRNILNVQVAAGKKVGDPVSVKPTYPELPWMTYGNLAVTAEKGSGDQLYLFNTDLAPVAEMRGTFAIDRNPKKEECSNKFGALTCAHYFKEYLARNGVEVAGIADLDDRGLLRAPDRTVLGIPADSLTVLGGTQSASLKKIAHITNDRSDNYYAETLYRTLGKVKGGSADYQECRKVESAALRRMGLDPSSVRIIDGSGLARDNWISPDFFCAFLRKLMDSPVYTDFLEILGSPGDPGSYAPRLQNEDKALKQRIRYKSGSMEGVRCYSGYIVPSGGGKEDTIVFSVMLNNCVSPSWSHLPVVDRIIALIASEN